MAVDELVHLLLVQVTAQCGLDLGQLGLDCVDSTEERFELRLNAAIAVQFGELREVADASALGDVDGPRIRGLSAEKKLQQSGLTCAVAADQTDAIAVGEAEEHLTQHHLLVVSLGNVVQANPAQASTPVKHGVR